MVHSLLAPHPRIAVRAAHVGLFLAAGLGLIVSVLDPWPAQLPGHDHLIVGAHGLREWAHALVSHRHEPVVRPARPFIYIQPAPAEPAVREPGAPRVFSIGQRLDGAGLAIFDLGAVLVADVEARLRLTIPGRSESVSGLGVCMLAPISVSVPLHPPRMAP